ncbi:hypothetical protein DCAR_0104704 [Daucus carota subsp. sativus]|uniref:Uncharacterized protein n=1 Tax=Daucus carota subsp. sativus TaxID=79200 RepID=A0AAF1AMI1_DAUCS|nr:hypothetical protein DCAR_0104704 [Daucus carota subsp. sativus]
MITKLISVLVFVTFFISSTSSCDDPYTASPIITQKLTGQKVQGKPQWQVTAQAPCSCCQIPVRLACSGFQTVEPLDSNVITRDGDVCSYLNSICPGHPTTFTYAWDQSYNFTVQSFTTACS